VSAAFVLPDAQVKVPLAVAAVLLATDLVLAPAPYVAGFVKAPPLTDTDIVIVLAA
jgi:hypothetical protein